MSTGIGAARQVSRQLVLNLQPWRHGGAWIVIGRMARRKRVLVAGDTRSQKVAVAWADVGLGLFVALE